MSACNDRLWTRRRWISQTGVAAGLALSAGATLAATPRKRPRIAALFTVMRFRSHAYNILENFFEPYLFNGQLVDPGCDIVSFFADQLPPDDMAREASRRLDVPLFDSIDAAMCAGGSELAVDGVLLIGEHGDYPINELHQQLYPRKQFFDQAVAAMRRAGRYVPLFNDKHLSYRWDWANEMYRTARDNRMPLMAGSSVPLAQRSPPLELPPEPEMEAALSVHGGGVESYDFHGLEVLQSIVEARRGGETGIRRVEFLSGDELLRAGAQGRWSRELFQAAMQAEAALGAKRQPRPAVGGAPSPPPQPDLPTEPKHGILVTYRDGFEAASLAAGADSSRWNFACRLKGDGKPRATAIFNGPWSNRCLFKALSHAIQHLFVQREEPYPAERTLLTTGALAAAMHSRVAQAPVDTPELEIRYAAKDFSAFRETGASWKIIREDTPQPTDFAPGDARFMKG